MATTKARVAIVQARNVEQLAEGVNAAIETLEASGFVAQQTEYRDDLDGQGMPVKVATVTAVHEDYLPVNADVLGDLTTLTTTAKGSAVAAINEVDAHADAATTEVARIGASYVETLYTGQADSAEIGTDTDPHDFNQTYTLAANKMAERDILEIEAYVLWSGAMAGAGDCEIKVIVQGVDIATISMVGVLLNEWLKIRIRLRHRPGASVAEIETDRLMATVQSRTVTRATGLAVDTKVAAIVKLSAEFSAANATNLCKLQELTVTAAHIN